MQRGEIVKAGYLTKSPPDKPMAQWHKRWFVLLDSKLVYPLAPRCVRLVYYQSEMEAKKLGNPKGEIDLSKCREIANREAIKGHKHVFDVYTQDRIYHLAAECIEDKQQWIGTLNKVLYGGQVESGQRSHSGANSRWSQPTDSSFKSPPTDVQLRKMRSPDDPLPRPLSYTGTGNTPLSSRPLPSLPPQNRPLPAPPSTSNHPSSSHQPPHPITARPQHSEARRTSSPVVNTHDLPPPPPPLSTNRLRQKTTQTTSVDGNISGHYEMAPRQTPPAQSHTRPTQRRKLTPQTHSLDTLCFNLPASEGDYREFIDIPPEPPKSIRKQYESRRGKPGHSQADYVNLPDESDDSKSDYVNLPDESDDSKSDYVNLPDESDDSKREYVNLEDNSEDSKREYVNLEEPAVDSLDTDYSYLQQSHVPGYDPTNQDYSHLEIISQYKRKGYEKPPRVPGRAQDGDYAHLKH